MDNYFVNIEDYNMKPYYSMGFSGQLYLITSKKSKIKFVVKHKEANFACCELAFSRIGRLLGAKLPKAYFVTHNNCDDFLSPYAVAVEYIEDLQPFQIEELNEKQIEQYIIINVLHVIFAQFDTIQMRKNKAGDIISYDFAESFFSSSKIRKQ